MSRGAPLLAGLFAGLPASLAALALLALAVGCTKDFTTRSDALRKEVLEQQKTITRLETEIVRRKAQVNTLEAALRTAGVNAQAAAAEAEAAAAGSPGDASSGRALPEGVEVPRFSGIRVDSYSGLDDADRDGVDDVVRLYAEPYDQKERMLPIAGTVLVQLLNLGEGEPEVLGTKRLDAAAWDAQYRDGFTGPYYLVEMPLEGVDPAGVDGLAVRLELTQAWSGATHGLTFPLR